MAVWSGIIGCGGDIIGSGGDIWGHGGAFWIGEGKRQHMGIWWLIRGNIEVKVGKYGCKIGHIGRERARKDLLLW